METEGFPLWEGCDRGDKKAWKKMLAYNKQDVIVTEQLYLSLRPWITNHPHFKDSKKTCPNCNSDNLSNRGYGINSSFKFHRQQCNDCGAWSQSRVNT